MSMNLQSSPQEDCWAEGLSACWEWLRAWLQDVPGCVIFESIILWWRIIPDPAVTALWSTCLGTHHPRQAALCHPSKRQCGRARIRHLPKKAGCPLPHDRHMTGKISVKKNLMAAVLALWQLLVVFERWREDHWGVMLKKRVSKSRVGSAGGAYAHPLLMVSCSCSPGEGISGFDNLFCEEFFPNTQPKPPSKWQSLKSAFSFQQGGKASQQTSATGSAELLL